MFLPLRSRDRLRSIDSFHEMSTIPLILVRWATEGPLKRNYDLAIVTGLLGKLSLFLLSVCGCYFVVIFIAIIGFMNLPRTESSQPPRRPVCSLSHAETWLMSTRVPRSIAGDLPELALVFALF